MAGLLNSLLQPKDDVDELQAEDMFKVEMDKTVIHELAANGHSKELQKILKKGGVHDVDARDEEFNMMTALHWACTKGHVKTMKVLLDNGASPNSVTSQGWTPFHYAAELGSLEALQLLVEYGGKGVCKDDFGATPSYIAKIYGHNTCVKFLDHLESHPAKRSSVLKDRLRNAARRSLIEVKAKKIREAAEAAKAAQAAEEEAKAAAERKRRQTLNLVGRRGTVSANEMGDDIKKLNDTWSSRRGTISSASALDPTRDQLFQRRGTIKKEDLLKRRGTISDVPSRDQLMRRRGTIM